ncbi:23S rRNA (pseudouridine(1915)-N(3))-methyltransferase RlmH [Candidatus Saccharibacteria bacterium]|nr:MAG: 23S rRNA (pseudouridine(1915)-N(3))-methyltransferase RlmH [Candidatus Saccharibacteria bacterium]
MIKIITIGKKHESWVAEGIERYSKRLRAPWNVEWVLLPHSAEEGTRARDNESHTIRKRLAPTDTVILLDERGTQLDSSTLSDVVVDYFVRGKQLVFVIGGAYGVDKELRARADLVLSLSSLVLPHQLVRLVVVEQLYRAQCIATAHPYHHL